MLALLQVLEAEPGNVKALYRRAQGHLAEQDLVEAELDIRAALLVSQPAKTSSHRTNVTVEAQSSDASSDIRFHDMQSTMTSAALAWRSIRRRSGRP